MKFIVIGINLLVYLVIKFSEMTYEKIFSTRPLKKTQFSIKIFCQDNILACFEGGSLSRWRRYGRYFFATMA